MLNGAFEALRPSQSPGDGHAHTAPSGPLQIPPLLVPALAHTNPALLPDPLWSLALSHIPTAASVCALEAAPDCLSKAIWGIFLRQVFIAQTVRGEHRERSCWHLKLRRCCKQTAQSGHPSYSQFLFPFPRTDPNAAVLQWTESWEALATPPVLATTQRTQPTVCRRGYNKGKSDGNGESSTSTCPRSQRTLVQHPWMRQPGGIARLGSWLGCLVRFSTLCQLRVLL